jgi:hypothetical protein
MEPTNNTARAAGALYLSLAVTAPFSLMYVPGRIIVSGNAAATAHNLRTFEQLFRIGIVGDVISNVLFMLTVVVLYRLLNRVDKMQASLMVLLAVIAVPVAFFNIASELVALAIAKGGTYLSAFNPQQLDGLATLFLTFRSHGNAVAEMFWGLWLFPFGLLVMRSRFLPRILGGWLLVNGFAYVALSLIALLAPAYANQAFKLAMPALFGEIAISLWLVIKGAKPEPLAYAVAAPA